MTPEEHYARAINLLDRVGNAPIESQRATTLATCAVAHATLALFQPPLKARPPKITAPKKESTP